MLISTVLKPTSTGTAKTGIAPPPPTDPTMTKKQVKEAKKEFAYQHHEADSY